MAIFSIERYQLALGTSLAAHDVELGTEDDGGIGLSAGRADLERLGGVLLGPIGVPGDLGPQRAHEQVSPVEDRLVELLGHVTVDGDAPVHLVEVAGPGRRFGAPLGGPEQQDRVTDPLGPHQGLRGPVLGELEQGRHLKGDVQVVEDLHHGGIVTDRLGDGDGLLGQSLAAFERASVGDLRAQGGKHQCPFGVRGRQQLERHLQRLDLLLVGGAHRAVEAPVVGQAGGHQPVDVAGSAAWCAAARSVARNDGFPVWRWEVPRPMARSSRRTGSGSATSVQSSMALA